MDNFLLTLVLMRIVAHEYCQHPEMNKDRQEVVFAVLSLVAAAQLVWLVW